MSATGKKRAMMADDIRASKGGTPLVSLTAYTTKMADMMAAQWDCVQVGDGVCVLRPG